MWRYRRASVLYWHISAFCSKKTACTPRRWTITSQQYELDISERVSPILAQANINATLSALFAERMTQEEGCMMSGRPFPHLLLPASALMGWRSRWAADVHVMRLLLSFSTYFHGGSLLVARFRYKTSTSVCSLPVPPRHPLFALRHALVHSRVVPCVGTCVTSPLYSHGCVTPPWSPAAVLPRSKLCAARRSLLVVQW